MHGAAQGFLELMEPTGGTEQHGSRGADNPAPRFALCTLRAKAHAKPALNRGEALRYLGYTGQAINGSLTARLERMAASCEEELNPSFTWRVFELDENRCRWGEQPLVALRNSSLAFEGKSINTHLKGARFAACLAATLGAESERRLRALSATSPLDAMLFDACCNALIEDVAQAAQDDIATEAAKAGLHARMRFSPGYGDLPLAVQPRFIQELDAHKRLGITVGESLLLTPAKSITAIVGLFDAPPPSTGRTPCQDCIAREYCSYLEKGITCYGNQHR